MSGDLDVAENPGLGLDARVIGAGPNGLTAAVVCASSGLNVTVYEADGVIGGGARSESLTIPGFLHDRCSSIYPLGAASPFFRALPITAFGLEWLHARYPLVHPLEDGDAVTVERSVHATALHLGGDGPTYERLLGPFVDHWDRLVDDVLAPPHWPRHVRELVPFGLTAVQPAARLARRFGTAKAQALVAGLAAHSGEPLDRPLTSAFALLLLALAHAVGWPVARGGAQSVADALASCLRTRGGTIITNRRVDTLDDLPPSTLTLCDVAPEHLADIARDRLPPAFANRLRRFSRSGGVFKVDWALDGPIPWRARECLEAGTVHVGGSFEEIAASEAAPQHGRIAERPFVIVAQPSVCDPGRAPAGGHVAWGYCHVPLAATADMTERIERQVERYAPGFRDRVLARHVMAPADLSRLNANLVGGDISGGAFTVRQWLARPTWRTYGTPLNGLYLCSASTPPGSGVHGMCGYWAARSALASLQRNYSPR